MAQEEGVLVLRSLLLVKLKIELNV